MELSPTTRILITTVITVALGSLVGLATAAEIDGWYATLNKPSFNPPNWIFGPVWTVLYILMGIAAGGIWGAGVQGNTKGKALWTYAIQLALNLIWSVLFFNLHAPALALVDILLLLPAIGWCMYRFRRIRPWTAYLLLPYLLWVSFATVLNAAIVTLN
ncbi:MAG: TspO/MBR family protein [Flavobacteriales bacterium]|nr:tryptophan-rich sensory protein [Flavobacteriales bacterium]